MKKRTVKMTLMAYIIVIFINAIIASTITGLVYENWREAKQGAEIYVLQLEVPAVYGPEIAPSCAYPYNTEAYAKKIIKLFRAKPGDEFKVYMLDETFPVIVAKNDPLSKKITFEQELPMLVNKTITYKRMLEIML